MSERAPTAGKEHDRLPDQVGDTLPPLTREDELAVGLARGRNDLASGRPAASIPHLEAALALAQSLGDAPGLIEAYALLTMALLESNRAQEAEQHAEHALSVARESGAPDSHVDDLKQLLAATRKSDDERALDKALNAGCRALAENEAAAAHKHLEAALAMARAHEFRHGECEALRLLARASIHTGDRDEAEVYVKAALELAEATPGLVDDDTICELQQISTIARASDEQVAVANTLSAGARAIAAGNAREAAAYFERARNEAQTLGDTTSEMLALGMLAKIHGSAGDAKPALRCAQTAVALAKTIDDAAAVKYFEELERDVSRANA